MDYKFPADGHTYIPSHEYRRTSDNATDAWFETCLICGGGYRHHVEAKARLLESSDLSRSR